MIFLVICFAASFLLYSLVRSQIDTYSYDGIGWVWHYLISRHFQSVWRNWVYEPFTMVFFLFWLFSHGVSVWWMAHHLVRTRFSCITIA
jgi:hypothetical protein